MNGKFIYLSFRFKRKLLSILVIAFLILFSSTGFTQVSGTVFRDLPVNGAAANTYGVKDANETGVVGVMVTVYPGGISTMTASNGTWSLPGTGTLRIEFSWTETWLKSSPVNIGSKSSVQFVNGGDTNVNFGLHNPADFSETNPRLASVIAINGDPLGGGTAAAHTTWMLFNYNDSGAHNAATYDALGSNENKGSTWGVAYQNSTHNVFTSAVVRRHSGLGTIDGTNTTTGGIYVSDISGSAPYSVQPWLDINMLAGVSTGIDPRTEEGSILPASSSMPNHDILAFDVAGKRGIGDIDVSEDDKKLYVVNLFQKTVLEIDIATKTLLNSYSIPNPGCSNGDYRPWAVEEHEGKLYVGVVCSAESSQSISDLQANVMRLDGGVFSTVFSFPLNYSRGFVAKHTPPYTNLNISGAWHPWIPTWNDIDHSGGYPTGEPTPILSDLEFEVDGTLILGINDFTGLKLGNKNYSTDSGDTGLNEGVTGGDILRACPDGSGGWNLENNGNCGGISTAGAGNNQGPGGGEFYFNEGVTLPVNLQHQETSWGSLAILQGSNEIVMAGMDPALNIRTGGIYWLSSTNGTKIDGYELYPDGNPQYSGKAGGVGDLELLAEPAPIEIGNLVWEDTDGDGVQDAGESGIAGVVVKLFKVDGTTLLETATTDATGNYIFSSATGSSTGSHRYGIAMLMPNNGYIVRIENASGGSQQAAIPGAASMPNVGEGANTDINDSDGVASGTKVEAMVMAVDISLLGANNHTFDFGFLACPPTRCSTVTVTQN